MMKTKLITALILLTFSFGAFGRTHTCKNTCRAIPSTLVAKDLKLDDASSAKLTELFKKYDAECKAIKEKYPQIRPQEGSQLTDKQLDANFKNQIASSRALLNLREKYYSKFREILSADQVAKIFKREREYGNRLKAERTRRQAPRNMDKQIEDAVNHRHELSDKQLKDAKNRIEKAQKDLERLSKKLDEELKVR
jgi:uncharacterized protein (DUF3084 family)